jgi:hypothetical protein
MLDVGLYQPLDDADGNLRRGFEQAIFLESANIVTLGKSADRGCA